MSQSTPEPEWLPSLYEYLYAIAERELAHERPGHSLQPTLLVNDACLQLMGQRNLASADRSRILAAGARTIRRLLVDYARKRKTIKRGGRKRKQSLSIDLPGYRPDVDLLEIQDALQRLREDHPDAEAVVELRFFGNLTASEIAENLGLSVSAVESLWAYAKAWLGRELRKGCG